MIDLLIVHYCSEDVVNDINNVSRYRNMKSFLLCKYLKQFNNNLNIKHIFSMDFFDKKSKNLFKYKWLNNQTDLKNVKHILFNKLGSLGKFSKNDIECILSDINGNIYKFEDTSIRLFPDQDRIITIGHLGKEQNGYRNFGYAVTTDIFKPIEKYKERTYRVHIDHNYKGRYNHFEKIVDCVSNLESKIKKSSYWKNIEIIYHDRLCPIKDLGHFNFKTIPIEELANIYGKTHVGFLSHRETLGQYPLELKSTGAEVISSKKQSVSKEMFDVLELTSFLDVDYDLLIDVDYLQQKDKYNRNLTLQFDYKYFVQKILQEILDFN
jgi:hypothetical protein